MIRDKVIVIGRWGDPRSKTITLQDFKQGNESFIPIFSDENHFREETKGSGFEDQGIGIDRDFFLSLLRGDELLILNPGSSNPVRLKKSDIAS
jgi:SseB protein N-terminal domain